MLLNNGSAREEEYGYLCIHVDPNETISIDLDMYSQQPILLFIELQVLIPRRLGQLSIQAI
jgi:hypothetical protein